MSLYRRLRMIVILLGPSDKGLLLLILSVSGLTSDPHVGQQSSVRVLRHGHGLAGEHKMQRSSHRVMFSWQAHDRTALNNAKMMERA
ncbi:hypothetical protein BS17DRAFT_781941 [Gyrodon lividus]|nr:hypothetical protein BS17DRAFT_781941 [Gyrodon lividus]